MHDCLGWGIDEGSEFMPGFAVSIGGLDEGGAVTDFVMAVGGDDDVHGGQLLFVCENLLITGRNKTCQTGQGGEQIIIRLGCAVRNEKKTGEKLHGHKETRPVGAVWGAERDAVSYWRVTL